MIKPIHKFWVLGLCLVVLGDFGLMAQDADEPKLTTEFSGIFKGDYRYFPDDALYAGQHTSYFSAYFQPEYYMEWDKGNQMIQFTGFARLDQHDNQSTHADIRELYWKGLTKKWEFSVGFKKIYWGVTESNHLVDIINQIDALEGFDIEQKLGQFMGHASVTTNWGTFDIHAMTGFREMRFPGTEGRPRPPEVINYDLTTFESDQDEFQPELAVRYSHYVGAFDFGLSHFYGTARAPVFLIAPDSSFFSFYELINQTGLDIQASTGSMLWKFEGIYRVSDRKTITAYTIGGEYTFSNMFSSGADIGLIVEYSHDDRGEELITALDDDYFFGVRLGLNDAQSTSLLAGVILDADNQTTRYSIKADRRFGSTWKVAIEAVGYANVSMPENSDKREFIYLLRNDGFLKASLAKYF